jgi:N-acetylmuramoyl-L-alanine amidase
MGLMRMPSAVGRHLATLAMLAAGAPTATLDVMTLASAQTAPSGPVARAPLPRPKPGGPLDPPPDRAVPADDSGNVAAVAGQLPSGFRDVARASGEPQIPGLNIVYLHPLGDPAHANPWRNIIVHQTEGPAGSARSMALAQAKNPTKRGVTIWVETDGTIYWSTAETAIPTHGDGANRNDNKYVDNSKTYRNVIRTNSIGVEFVGNFPDVARPPTREQEQAWLMLVRFLQERYDIPAENIYAHNWIDFKDRRYCEGCELATLARRLGYSPTGWAKGSE